MRAAPAISLALGITIALILAMTASAGALTEPPTTGAGACSGETIIDLAAARVRLLNNDGERTYGPIPVTLDSGVYTVDTASWDRHDDSQITQPEEQWRVAADTGWSSPLTLDIPDDAQQINSTFTDQHVSQPIMSITIVHKGAGIVNSVSPQCVGFTRTGDINRSDADGSATSIVRPPEDDTPDEPDTPAETPDTPDTDPSADGTSDSIEVEVDGQIELPPALARTGPPLTTIAGFMAAVFVLLGGYAVGWSRRLAR